MVILIEMTWIIGKKVKDTKESYGRGLILLLESLEALPSMARFIILLGQYLRTFMNMMRLEESLR